MTNESATVIPDATDATWFKSSHSGGHGDCVEVAFLRGGKIGVRDSKDPTGPALVFTPSEWDAFAAGVAHGEFDRP
ncbi:DUF397 domain-containing protein [Nocardia gipuzkoensis]|uniref:DUF397 domain-containing protein n=1 Tax=Nocardia gipuzkoensis TaxID=2749991 RepID=UPI001E326C13|nr:DUF397 domain-containing protein [Nocardia gipuzkoensis]UGT70533.1 DUF397 domain-containing protein [Nocardia gipuzkoensis]